MRRKSDLSEIDFPPGGNDAHPSRRRKETSRGHLWGKEKRKIRWGGGLKESINLLIAREGAADTFIFQRRGIDYLARTKGERL